MEACGTHKKILTTHAFKQSVGVKYDKMKLLRYEGDDISG